ncbi:unknown [Sinorhizobium phage PBC5]|uniref:transcriptional regulator n=1 Tax=Sinorhizobium phage PBC5 TaxID=179237 RepID=UPI000009BA1F|nr:transcriptional regulator [Sinorhizobium phage PBC5]AAL49625.1 unknown [Sinorhizobium phage PBC5]
MSPTSVKTKFQSRKTFSQTLWFKPPNLRHFVIMGTRSKIQMSPEGKPRHFIKEWRKHRRMTQEQLASAVGSAVSSVSQLESGKQGYSQATLEALAVVLQCSPADLLSVNPIEGLPDEQPREEARSLLSLLDNLRNLANAHPERVALALEALEQLTDRPGSDQTSGTKDNQ